jgi:hypothetical protein
MSRTRVTHLDKAAPSGTPSPITNSFSACGRAVHYTAVTNVKTNVICWYCKQTQLYKSLP